MGSFLGVCLFIYFVFILVPSTVSSTLYAIMIDVLWFFPASKWGKKWRETLVKSIAFVSSILYSLSQSLTGTVCLSCTQDWENSQQRFRTQFQGIAIKLWSNAGHFVTNWAFFPRYCPYFSLQSQARTVLQNSKTHLKKIKNKMSGFH